MRFIGIGLEVYDQELRLVVDHGESEAAARDLARALNEQERQHREIAALMRNNRSLI